MTRTFQDTEAVRSQVNLMLGLVGASGSGKTGSALELAHGIQEVTGGEIYMIDTESKRGLHYAGAKMFSDPAKVFKYRHIDLKAPFSPLDYLAALEHAVSKGAKIIIVDSMSHEHEGPGGVLEMHEAELNRIAGDDEGKRNRVSMLAWAKPKAERRRLINSILQMPAMFVFCFRAKEKIKLVKGQDPKPLGFMPIAGEEFVFEMTQNFLLYPASLGIPTWTPHEDGEKLMTKSFEPFKVIFKEAKSISAWHGRQMALWAKGGATPAKPAEAPAAKPTAESLPI